MMADLIRKLYKNTLSGKVTWTSGPDRCDVRANLAGYMIKLRCQEAPPVPDADQCLAAPQATYHLIIASADGKEMIDKAVISGVSPLARQKDLIAELFDIAFEQATGVEKALGAILNELD